MCIRDRVKSIVDAAAVKKDLAVNKAIDFVKEKANIVLGAAEEKKPAKKTTRKTTKKAAAKKDEEPKEEEKGEYCLLYTSRSPASTCRLSMM